MRFDVQHNIPELLAWLDRAPDIAVQELIAAVWEAELLFERRVKENTPRGVSSGAGLKGSIAAQIPEVLLTGVIGLVSTSIGHATPVALGTKPHFPPIEPLELWVRKKLGIEGKEARSVAFAIAKTISRKGTEGAQMFKKAYESTEAQLEQILTDGVRRAVERMRSGA